MRRSDSRRQPARIPPPGPAAGNSPRPAGPPLPGDAPIGLTTGSRPGCRRPARPLGTRRGRPGRRYRVMPRSDSRWASLWEPGAGCRLGDRASAPPWPPWPPRWSRPVMIGVERDGWSRGGATHEQPAATAAHQGNGGAEPSDAGSVLAVPSYPGQLRPGLAAHPCHHRVPGRGQRGCPGQAGVGRAGRDHAAVRAAGVERQPAHPAHLVAGRRRGGPVGCRRVARGARQVGEHRSRPAEHAPGVRGASGHPASHRRSLKVSFQLLLGALCVYLLFGLVYTYLFTIIGTAKTGCSSCS